MDSTKMMDRFTDLIRNSRPVLPGDSTFRRLNRLVLREPTIPASQGRNRRRTFVMVTACLALLVLFSGQVNQLGSDDFEYIAGTAKDSRGLDVRVYEDTFDGSSLMSNMSVEEVTEYQQAYAANDGTPSKLVGYEYGGRAQWIVYRKFMIDGVLQERPAENPPWLPQDTPRDFGEFMKTHNQEMKTRMARIPPTELFTLEIFGVAFRVQAWKHTFPKYGEVIYSRGYPLEN